MKVLTQLKAARELAVSTQCVDVIALRCGFLRIWCGKINALVPDKSTRNASIRFLESCQMVSADTTSVRTNPKRWLVAERHRGDSNIVFMSLPHEHQKFAVTCKTVWYLVRSTAHSPE